MTALIVRASYHIALSLYLFLLLPKLLFDWAMKGKYRGSARARFIGSVPLPMGRLVMRPVIWFHAVSVGEVKALAALLPFVKRDYPNAFIFISTITKTGLNSAKQELCGADAYGHLPLDFPFSARRFVNQLKPDLLVLIEGDYWFNVIRRVKALGGVVAVVSGKLSKRSMRRYQAFSPFSRALFGLVDHFYLQNNTYASRFSQLKVPLEKLTVLGNLKFDLKSALLTSKERTSFCEKLGFAPTDSIIVIGSTHKNEERELIRALLPLLSEHQNLKIALLPRHPERFGSIKKMLKKEGIDHAVFSQAARKVKPIILVDQMGLLPKCYQLATLALVGGSYFPGVGGHDIFEPASLGVPVLFGPYMETQSDFVHAILKAGAGRQTPLGELKPLVNHLLSHRKELAKMGERGDKLAKEMRGVASRYWQELKSLLRNRPD